MGNLGFQVLKGIQRCCSPFLVLPTLTALSTLTTKQPGDVERHTYKKSADTTQYKYHKVFNQQKPPCHEQNHHYKKGDYRPQTTKLY
jgi:hypothetical protein